ncbi:hypothetical protein O181_103972, partial [Austropuccinia psidii MF-1]|nr:hypothetical protein [Austropuccinia psidii MF-1]
QENIETASTVTSIIPASTVNSDHNSTAIITHNNQPEPISSELISLDISNTLQKAKNLANKAQEPAITPQEAPKKVIDVIMEEANKLHKDKGQADTTTRRLSGHLKSQPEGLKQGIAAQRVPDPSRSVEKLHELLPDCEKIPGPSQHLQVTQSMKSIDGKEHDAFPAEWRKNNPPPPKQVPKTAPIASSSNSNVKKQPQAQKKGKGKALATRSYSHGYRIPKIQQDAMEIVFQMARTMMELPKKDEARLKYQK